MAIAIRSARTTRFARAVAIPFRHYARRTAAWQGKSRDVPALTTKSNRRVPDEMPRCTRAHATRNKRFNHLIAPSLALGPAWIFRMVSATASEMRTV